MEEKCASCDQPMEQIDGKLDQSGNTHIPTIVLHCKNCGCNTWKPAPSGTEWKPNQGR